MCRHPIPEAAWRQRGQSMPLVLVFLIVLCVGLLVTFNTGQVVSKKVEVTNAADAAAYSVAVEQARARNLAAYLNRGRVANEVAIAQVVSLNSWLTMVHSTSDNFGDFMKVVSVVFAVVPGLNVALRAIERAMAAINKALKQFRKAAVPALGGAVSGMDLLNLSYATAARAALEPVAGASAYKLAERVVQDNSPDAYLTTRGKVVLANDFRQADDQLDRFRRGTQNGLSSTNRGMERYRNVVMASRDEFSRARSSGGFGVFRSNGGTDMVEYGRWSGVDVFEIRVPIPLASDFTFPLGWGGTQAVQGRQQPRFFRGMNHGNGWRSPYENNRRYRAYNGVSSNGIAGRFIENDPAGPGFRKRDAYFSGYRHGIRHYYRDVKGEGDRTRYSRTPDGDDAGPIYTVEVATKARNARTSSAIGVGAGRMELRDEARKDEIRAMASAQVYFNRPYHLAQMRRSVFGRGDRKFEMGNMFSPYWQARLVDTPNADRVILVGG